MTVLEELQKKKKLLSKNKEKKKCLDRGSNLGPPAWQLEMLENNKKIEIPWPGIEPRPLDSESGVLTTILRASSYCKKKYNLEV